jgi:hypothetical protein
MVFPFFFRNSCREGAGCFRLGSRIESIVCGQCLAEPYGVSGSLWGRTAVDAWVFPDGLLEA